MLDASVDCIKMINIDGTLDTINRSGRVALGLTEHQALGVKWLSLLPPEVRPRGRKALRVARSGKKSSFCGKSVSCEKGIIVWDNILTPVHGADNEVVKILCVSRNITKQIVAQEKLRKSSEIDDLTGFYNRKTFLKIARKKIYNAKRHGNTLGSLMIDLDNFKRINDTFGHGAGDHVIRCAARSILDQKSSGETAGRLGGR